MELQPNSHFKVTPSSQVAHDLHLFVIIFVSYGRSVPASPDITDPFLMLLMSTYVYEAQKPRDWPVSHIGNPLRIRFIQPRIRLSEPRHGITMARSHSKSWKSFVGLSIS